MNGVNNPGVGRGAGANPNIQVPRAQGAALSGLSGLGPSLQRQPQQGIPGLSNLAQRGMPNLGGLGAGGEFHVLPPDKDLALRGHLKQGNMPPGESAVSVPWRDDCAKPAFERGKVLQEAI